MSDESQRPLPALRPPDDSGREGRTSRTIEIFPVGFGWELILTVDPAADVVTAAIRQRSSS
jgi:hypothetical protein